MEDLAGGTGINVNGSTPIESEQRGLAVQPRTAVETPPDLFAHQFGDAGSVRDEATLPELAAAHHEQAAVRVDVTQAQPTHFTCTQSQPVAEAEDGAIRRAPMLSGRAVAAASTGGPGPCRK